MLTKPIALFLAPVFCFLLFMQTDAPFKKRLSWIMIGLIVEMLVLSPWLIRNYSDFNKLSVSTITNTNLFGYNYKIMLADMVGEEKASIRIKQIRLDMAREYKQQWENPFVQATALGSFAKKEIMNNFQKYLATVIKHHHRLYLGTGIIALLRLVGDNAGVAALETWTKNPNLPFFLSLPIYVIVIQLVSWFIMGIFYLLVIFGVPIIMIKKEWRRSLIILGSALAYFVIVIGPVVATRYRLPITLFLSPIAAFAAITIFSFLKSRLMVQKNKFRFLYNSD